jgi:hypothetical protein
MLFVILTASAVLFLLAAYAFGSDFRELAFNRLQDDSYYYLQPAWNLPRLGFFTFDGENPTYGFQPLWMLFLSVISVFSPDRVFFLRMSVFAGGLFFCLTAVVLFFFLRRWFGPWPAVIAPVLWVANPVLAGAFITAKENALYALLFALCAWAVVRFRGVSPGRAWPAGVMLGLLVLCRVNALIPAMLFLIILYGQGVDSRGVRARRMLVAGSAMAAVLIPWCVYALLAFGTVFPNSGSAKLVDSTAALAWFAKDHIPGPAFEWIRSLLPSLQQTFLSRPEFLAVPTKAQAVSYLTGFLPDRAYGSWAGLFAFLGVPDYRGRLILLAVIAIAAVAVCLLEWRRPPGDRRTVSAVALAVFAAAGANTLSNWLLMPAYLEWGVWYAVPEFLAMILALGLVFARPLEFLAGRIRLPAIGWMTAASGAVLVLAGTVQFARTWSPKDSAVPFEATQQQAHAAAVWMEEHLPPGARIASFSAGLLGYFAPDLRVINIDGLANTPDYVDSVLTGHLLNIRGLAAEDPVRAYLAEARIGYLANVDTVDRIDRGEYLGLVDPGGGLLLYRGDRPIQWGPDAPERRMIVVELLP